MSTLSFVKTSELITLITPKLITLGSGSELICISSTHSILGFPGSTNHANEEQSTPLLRAIMKHNNSYYKNYPTLSVNSYHNYKTSDYLSDSLRLLLYFGELGHSQLCAGVWVELNFLLGAYGCGGLGNLCTDGFVAVFKTPFNFLNLGFDNHWRIF